MSFSLSAYMLFECNAIAVFLIESKPAPVRTYFCIAFKTCFKLKHKQIIKEIVSNCNLKMSQNETQNFINMLQYETKEGI